MTPHAELLAEGQRLARARRNAIAKGVPWTRTQVTALQDAEAFLDRLAALPTIDPDDDRPRREPKEILQELADYHDQNYCMADACDAPGSARFHDQQLRLVQAVIANDCKLVDPSAWQPIETAPQRVRDMGEAVQAELGRHRMRLASDIEHRDSKPFSVVYVLWVGPKLGDHATHWWTGTIDGLPPHPATGAKEEG